MSIVDRLSTLPFHLTTDQSKQITKQIHHCLAIGVLLIFLLSVLYWTVRPSTVPPCYTTACLKTANFILSTTDYSADPCEDFRKFSCEKQAKERFGKETTFRTLTRYATNTMTRMLIEPRLDENNLTVGFRQQRKFFRACMNKSAIEADDHRGLYIDLGYVVGEGWPFVIIDKAKTGDWYDIQALATERGFLTKFFLDSDLYPIEESGIVHLELKAPSLEKLWKVFPRIQNGMGVMFYYLPEVLYEVIQVGFFIENLRLPANEALGDLSAYESIAVSKFHSVTTLPQLDWVNILKRLFDLRPNDRVFYKPSLPEYLYKLIVLILGTERKIWLNYVALTLIFENCLFLSETYRNLCMEKDDDSDLAKRVDRCAEMAREIYPNVLETQLVRKTVSKRHRDNVRTMFDLIKLEMIDVIRHGPWIKDDLKPLAVEIADRLSPIVGASDLFWNDTEFEEAYRYKEVSGISEQDPRFPVRTYKEGEARPNPIHLARQANLDTIHRLANYLRKPLKYFEGRHEPRAFASAYHFLDWHEIKLTSPLLAPPIYDPDRPEYANFGSLGSIIAHELSHVFHPEASNARHNNPFWTLRSEPTLLHCPVAAYQRYASSLGYRVSPHVAEVANDENFADFASVNLAYRAYQTWVDRHGSEPPLIGVRYTPNQIFWIMTTVSFCNFPSNTNPISPVATSKDAVKHAYAVDDFRLMGPLMNSPYFGPDYDCSDDSRMNSKFKCNTLALTRT